MPTLPTRPIAPGLDVSILGLGGTGLGNMYSAVDAAAAARTVEAALDGGITYFDTAPVYGYGLAETRLGEALSQTLGRGGRDRVVISSKVGYELTTVPPSEVPASMWAATAPIRADHRFTRDAVLRSIEGTLKRLGVDAVDMLAIHDPDEASVLTDPDAPLARSRFKDAMDGAYPVLDELRSQGVIKAVGVGINQWQMLAQFVSAGRFDYFLLANRYTLLDQSPLEELFPRCAERGTAIVAGGPFNSGILASGAVDGAMFDYRPASPAMLQRVRRMEAVCARHGVALAAAALQFPLMHPQVATVVAGARSPAEQRENLGHMHAVIGADFWDELKAEGLIDARSPTTT